MNRLAGLKIDGNSPRMAILDRSKKSPCLVYFIEDEKREQY